MGLHPTEMELREHHCLGDEVYILAGEGPDGIADDPLNAWIPRGTTFEEHNVSDCTSPQRLFLFSGHFPDLPPEWNGSAL